MSLYKEAKEIRRATDTKKQRSNRAAIGTGYLGGAILGNIATKEVLKHRNADALSRIKLSKRRAGVMIAGSAAAGAAMGAGASKLRDHLDNKKKIKSKA